MYPRHYSLPLAHISPLWRPVQLIKLYFIHFTPFDEIVLISSPRQCNIQPNYIDCAQIIYKEYWCIALPYQLFAKPLDGKTISKRNTSYLVFVFPRS